MAEVSSSTFSEVDGSNNSTAPNGFPEGMAMSGMNDSGRGVMGAVKRFWGRINGRYASTGSSNAYVLTYDVALGSYVTGERYSFRANFENTGSATLNISSLGAKTIKKITSAGATALASGDIKSGQPVTVEYDGTDMILCTPTAGTATSAGTGISITGGAVAFNPNGLSAVTPDLNSDYLAGADASDSNNPKKFLARSVGRIAQIVKSQDGAVATGSTVMVNDDSIPQNTEGDQYLSLAITPTSASSTLIIDVVWNGTNSSASANTMVAGLFQDSTANALAAVAKVFDANGNADQIEFTHTMTAGTTSATTFKVRVGGVNAGTTTFNGTAGARRLGGVMASSIVITELLP
jgi:hypothetical protein